MRTPEMWIITLSAILGALPLWSFWIFSRVEIVWFPNFVRGKKEVLGFPKMKDWLMRAYPVVFGQTGLVPIMPDKPPTTLKL
jgi:hypothetical protein